MNKVGLIFDSTAIVPQEMAEKYGFEFVSLYLDIDGTSHLSTSIDEKEFLANFASYHSLKSASPSPQAFVDAYEKQFAKGFEKIIVLPLSSKLSATHDVALIARGLLDESKQDKVIVLDTLVCSLGFDSLMQSMYPFLDQDLEAEALVKIILDHAENSTILFEINDLKNLYRGGRLKKLSLILGEILGFKPLVEFDDGVLNVIAKNRNRNKNVEIILNKIGELSKKFKKVYVNHFAFNLDDAAVRIILEHLRQQFSNVIINFTSRICPVYISHVGNSGYAIAITAHN
jgi:DegV family protein with EDD domain